MWKCPVCGNINQNDVCVSCGYKESSSQERKDVGQKVNYSSGEVKKIGENKQDNKLKAVLIAGIVVMSIAVIVIIFLIIMNFITKSAINPSETTSEPIETQMASDSRLYDNHNEFIKKVRMNLNVPDDSEITYKIGEPEYVEAIEMEVVYVTFVKNGETVAASECATKDGSLMRATQMYNPDLAQRVNTHTSAPPDNSKENKSSSYSHSANNNSNSSYYSYENVTYDKYYNSLYGYTLSYPDFLVVQQETGNSSGKTFESVDGEVSVNVYGSYTPSVIDGADTLDGLFRYHKNNVGYVPTYESKKDNFFVLSGYQGDKIVYEKHILKSDGTENYVIIVYPASQKEAFDPIVTHISKNITTGIGINSAVVE